MNIQVHACVGGTAVRDDIRTLQNGVHIVVGTPGRVFDMISRRALSLVRLVNDGEVIYVLVFNLLAVAHPSAHFVAA